MPEKVIHHKDENLLTDTEYINKIKIGNYDMIWGWTTYENGYEMKIMPGQLSEYPSNWDNVLRRIGMVKEVSF